MKIGIISDAHGNPSGLLACLNFFKSKQINKIYFLGDAVGYMPDWKGVFELLDKFNVICIRGNHDQMALEIELPKKNTIYNITQELKVENYNSLKKVEKWPTSRSIKMQNNNIMFVHGSPWNQLNGYIYPNTDMEKFMKVDEDVVFMGHTHRPFIKNLGNKLIVNTGSCGLPRDIGSLVSCSTYNTETNECKIHRIPQDIENIISIYGSQLHHSVINCLRRNDNNYYGELIDK